MNDMPYFEQLQAMNELILESDNHGERIAEVSLESLVSFNEDMKVLALNAYQLQDLMKLSLQENEVLVEWIQRLEDTTLLQEEEFIQISNFVE